MKSLRTSLAQFKNGTDSLVLSLSMVMALYYAIDVFDALILSQWIFFTPPEGGPWPYVMSSFKFMLGALFSAFLAFRSLNKRLSLPEELLYYGFLFLQLIRHFG